MHCGDSSENTMKSCKQIRHKLIVIVMIIMTFLQCLPLTSSQIARWKTANNVPCPLDCANLGVCTMRLDGTSYCKCQVGYTGDRCQDTLTTEKPSSPESKILSTASSTTTTPPHSNSTRNSTSLRPLSERQCPIGFNCRHGYCLKLFTCACDKGWFGLFCHKACNLDCGSHGWCNDVNRRQICVCNKGFLGSTCNKSISTDSSSTCDNCTTPSSITVLLPIFHNADVNNSDQRTSMRPLLSNTLSNETLSSRPINEQCMPGFVCQYGVCVKGRLKCTCNKGWTGIFCHQQCSLDCGEHGRCYVQTGSTAFCTCIWPYTGSKCQHKTNVTLPKTNYLSSTSTSPGATTSSSGLTNSTVDNSTLRPLSERRCVQGFVCRHGYCKDQRQYLQTAVTGRVLECVCDRGWKGIFCHVPCPLECGNHGNCSEFANKTLYCSCNFKYTGSRCQELRPLPKPETVEAVWHWWVIGSCVGLLLILITLLVIIPYWLWKRKEIFIMKIVFMFQPFEDEDDKLYDAFVSYKSTELDEHFVVHTLYPKLEKMMDFKLCLHFRDFLPGETIANNIIQAMENSRRTILILTPSYVQSEFCRFEYQRAQHEMLKRKQRIIPIMLQDIASDRMFMDDTLKNILDTITYITWPSDQQDKKIDKFWKRLELSMPKKRNLSNSTDLTDALSDTTQTSKRNSFPEIKPEKIEMSSCNYSMTKNNIDISKIEFFENFAVPDLQLSSEKV